MKDNLPFLYTSSGRKVLLYYTLSGMLGSEKEFMKYCQKNPGFVEIERVVRNGLGMKIYSGDYPTPLQYSNEQFEEKYGHIGGGRSNQLLWMMQITPDMLLGINEKPINNKKPNLISKLIHKIKFYSTLKNATQHEKEILI
jgi:hypothetical protein